MRAKNLLLFLGVFLFVFYAGSLIVSANSCNVVLGNTCSSGVKVMGLTSQGNAFGSMPNQNSVYSLCCSGTGTTTTNSANKILGLSSITNAYASAPSENPGYTNIVGYTGLQSCQISTTPVSNKECVITLSASTGAKLADCNKQTIINPPPAGGDHVWKRYVPNNHTETSYWRQDIDEDTIGSSGNLIGSPSSLVSLQGIGSTRLTTYVYSNIEKTVNLQFNYQSGDNFVLYAPKLEVNGITGQATFVYSQYSCEGSQGSATCVVSLPIGWSRIDIDQTDDTGDGVFLKYVGSNRVSSQVYFMNSETLANTIDQGAYPNKIYCALASSPPPAPICGDGIINAGSNEQCDGSALNGMTCQSLGYTAGTLSCSSSCTFTGCTGTPPPAGTITAVAYWADRDGTGEGYKQNKSMSGETVYAALAVVSNGGYDFDNIKINYTIRKDQTFNNPIVGSVLSTPDFSWGTWNIPLSQSSGDYYFVAELIDNSTNNLIIRFDSKNTDESIYGIDWNDYGFSGVLKVEQCGNNKVNDYVNVGEQCDLGTQNGIAGSGCTSLCRSVSGPPPVVDYTNVGSCTWIQTGQADTCADGYLTYEWNPTWAWSPTNENYPLDANGACTSRGNNFIKSSDNRCRYDPNRRSLDCVETKSETIPCPSKTKVPFFGIWQFSIGLLIVLAVYAILIKRRR